MALGIFDIIFKVTGANEAVQSLKNIKNEAKSTADGLDKTKQSTENFGKSLGGLLVGGAVIGMAKGALDAAAKYDSMERALATTVGSTAELSAQMERLRKVAQSPGIDLQQTVQGFTRLRSTGKFSAKEAEEGLVGIANAVASVGAPAATVERVVTAISQIAGGMQVNQEELGQLREALPQFAALMDKAFGTANAEQIRNMGVSAENAAKGILKAFGQGPKATAGLQTGIDNINDALFDLNVSIGKIIGSFVLAFGDDIIKNIAKATELIKTMATEGTALNAVFKAFAALAIGLMLVDIASKFGILVTAIKSAITALKALNIAQLIAKAIANPALGLAAVAAAAAAGFAGKMLFDEIDAAMAKGNKPIEATGGTSGGKGGLTPPSTTDLGKAAGAAAGAAKSTEGKGGGLINTMVAIAEYAARMQAAFVDLAKGMEAQLFEIAKNTGSTRDLLDLRKQTFGGGRLGAIGVTAAELNAGNNATNVGGVGIIPQTLIPASTDLERSMRKMMIQYGRQQLVTEMRRI